MANIPGSTTGNKGDKQGSSETSSNSIIGTDTNSGAGNGSDKNGTGDNGLDNRWGDDNNNRIDISNIDKIKVYQLDSELPTQIRKTGCNILVCGFLASLFSKRKLIIDNYKVIYHYLIRKKLINDKCVVLDMEKLITHFFKMLKENKKCIHVGNSEPRFDDVKTDMTILKYKTTFGGEYGFEHYKAGDQKGKKIYDPMYGKLDNDIIFKEFLRFRIDI